MEGVRAWGPGSPTPLLTPPSGSVPQAPGPPPLSWAVGRMLVREGREEGRQAGRQAGSEALRGRGQGWVMGRQAQEVSPWPAIWPVTSPGAWRCFSLKLGSRLLPPRPRASLLPTPHCLLCSLVPQAWRKHLLCPGSQEAGLQVHGEQQAGPLGAVGASKAGPPGEEGAQDALWTEQALSSAYRTSSSLVLWALGLAPPVAPEAPVTPGEPIPGAGLGPSSLMVAGAPDPPAALASSLASPLEPVQLGAFVASPHTPLLEGRGCG